MQLFRPAAGVRDRENGQRGAADSHPDALAQDLRGAEIEHLLDAGRSLASPTQAVILMVVYSITAYGKPVDTQHTAVIRQQCAAAGEQSTHQFRISPLIQ